MMAAAGCLGWIIVVQLVDVAGELPRYRQNINAKMEALRIPTEGPLGLAANSLKEIGSETFQPGRTLSGPRFAGAESETAHRAEYSRASSARTDRATGGHWIGLPSPSAARSSASGIDRTGSHLHGLHADQGDFDLRHRLFRLAGLGQINLMTQALDDAAQRVSRYLLMQILVKRRLWSSVRSSVCT